MALLKRFEIFRGINTRTNKIFPKEGYLEDAQNVVTNDYNDIELRPGKDYLNATANIKGLYNYFTGGYPLSLNTTLKKYVSSAWNAITSFGTYAPYGISDSIEYDGIRYFFSRDGYGYKVDKNSFSRSGTPFLKNITKEVRTSLSGTFVDGDVDPTANTITKAGIAVDGQIVKFSSTGTLPTGLLENTYYFVAVFAGNVMKVYDFPAVANSAFPSNPDYNGVDISNMTEVDITSASGGGVHSIIQVCPHTVGTYYYKTEMFFIDSEGIENVTNSLSSNYVTNLEDICINTSESYDNFKIVYGYTITHPGMTNSFKVKLGHNISVNDYLYFYNSDTTNQYGKREVVARKVLTVTNGISDATITISTFANDVLFADSSVSNVSVDLYLNYVKPNIPSDLVYYKIGTYIIRPSGTDKMRLFTPIDGDIYNRGEEIITNAADRDMSAANNWSGTNWALTGSGPTGEFAHSAAAGQDVATLAGYSAVINTQYRIRMTIRTTTEGYVQIAFGGVTNSTKYPAGTAASVYITVTAINTNGLTVWREDGVWIGSIDDVSVMTVPSTTASGAIYTEKESDYFPIPKAKTCAVWQDVMFLGNITPVIVQETNVIVDDDRQKHMLMWSDTTGDNRATIESFNSSLENSTIVGNDEDGEITAIRTNNESLVIFKTRAIYVMSGTVGTNNLVLRKLEGNTVGCSTHNSIQEIGNVLFFLSDTGVFAFQVGQAKCTELSEAIKSILDDTGLLKSAAVSCHDYKRRWYVLHIPHSTPANAITLIYDYYRNGWWVWRGIDASGGMIYDGSNIQFIEPKAAPSTDGKHFKLVSTSYQDTLDETAPTPTTQKIDAYIKWPWETINNPSMQKKFKGIKIYSLYCSANMDLNVKCYTDWESTARTDENVTLSVSPNVVITEEIKVDSGYRQAKCLSTKISNATTNQKFAITGIEVELEDQYFESKKFSKD